MKMQLLKNLLNRFFPDEPLAVDERRSSVRLSFRQEVSLKTPQGTFEAVTHDLTFTGLSLEMKRALPGGTEVTVHRDSMGPPFNGTVRWCKGKPEGDFLLGIECELDEEKLINSWLEPALIEAGFEASFVGERRRLLRVPGRVPCELTGPAGSVHQGFMLDLSAGGALFEGDQELAEGESVSFKTSPRGDAVQPLSGKALVKSARATENGKWMVGLNFEQTDAQTIQANMKHMLSS